MPKGKPKKDGSGQGNRENYNRGGCQDGETCEISDIVQRQYRRRVK